MNKLARVLAILIGVSAIWLLRPDVARADTPITVTTTITEVYATRATVFGMSCNGPNAQWGPFDLENIAGEPDGQYGGILRSIYVDYLGQCGQYSIVFDFGDIYTATSFSAYHYNQISIRDPELSICTNADCWETRNSGYWVWSGGGGWWIVSGPDWSGSTIRQDMGVRYLRHKMSGESGDPYGLKFGIDAIKLTLANPITKTEVISVPDCYTIDNSDFISGTTSWTATNVITAPSEVIFETGGLVAQSVDMTYAPSITDDVTVRWVGRSTETFPVNATVTLNTIAGSGSATRQFSGLKQEFTNVISGYFASDYEIVINADQGFALDYVCVTPSGVDGSTGAETCYTVDDASFDSGEPWTLTGSASVAGGSLSLGAGAEAAQSVSLTPGTYTVVMSSTFAGAGDLSVGLGDHTEVITLPVGASLSYQQDFDVTGGDTLSLSSTSGGVSVQYLCYNEQTRAYGECLPVIPNGEFDTNTAWQYRNGAVWNNVAANAFIPAISGGTFGNVGLGAVGQYPLNGMLPDLLPGEFLILQFDARSIDNGIVTARMRDINLADSVAITATFPTENQYTRYQVPVSQLAGHDGSTMDLGFFNTGLITGTTGTTATDIAVFVDNVCLYLSNGEPQLPVTNPIYGGYNGGLPFTCGTVSQWLYELTGINFPELETMEMPAAWDFSNWVPWLAGRLWVNIGKPIACLLVSLFNSSPFMAINNFIHWIISITYGIFNWVSDLIYNVVSAIVSFMRGFSFVLWWNIQNVIMWFYQNLINGFNWVGYVVVAVVDIIMGWFNWFRDLFLMFYERFIYFFESIANWFMWLWSNLLNALGWLVESLRSSMSNPWGIFTDIIGWVWQLVTALIAWAWDAGIAALEWCWDALSQFPGWLWDSLIAVVRWVSGAIIAGMTGLFNLLVGAWNLLLPGLRSFFSGLLNLLVQLWNWIAPMFGDMSGIFDTIWQLLQAVGENVIGIVTGLWGTFTTLAAIMFENFGETIGLPMEFYNAFSDAVSSEPFVFIPDCSTGGTLWCNFIFGIQLVNYIAGQSIMYPIVIVLIIILTIIVIQKHIWETIKPPGLR